MKNFCKLGIILLLLSISIGTNANAVDWLDFDDATLWDHSQASKANIGWSPDAVVSGRYNAYANGSGNDSAGIYSQWGFDASQDFGMKADFNFSAPVSSGGAAIGFYFAPFGSTDGLQSGPGVVDGGKKYFWANVPNGGAGPFYIDRTFTSGTFHNTYHAATNTIAIFSGAEYVTSFTIPDPGGAIIQVGFEVLSNDGTIPLGSTYFENVQITTGTIVPPVAAPEPLSAALFLLGGAGLVIGRKKRRK